MCCFGIRVFLLIATTVLSFVLHKFYPQIPVIGYYLLLANLLSFCIFFLFFRGLLPTFVKEGAVHYFSFIGGVLGGILATIAFGGFKFTRFLKIEILIFCFWIIVAAFIALNFAEVSNFFAEFLK